VLVLRETTERPEGVAAGTAKLVGTNPDAIYKAVRKLLTSRSAYNAMAKAISPYGDGKAAARILRILRQRVRTAAKRPTSHHSQEPERS
jgi:UDP-N-acetylglucosamine 2-epimerase (non-hydrolysing)